MRYRVTLFYDAVEVGHTVLSSDDLGLEVSRRTFILDNLNLDHRLICGPPFCRGGQRPLSVESTRWAIEVEPVYGSDVGIECANAPGADRRDRGI